MSSKAVVGRALRETGAALKQASGAEVRLVLVVTAAMVCGYTLRCDQSWTVWRTKLYALIGTGDELSHVRGADSSFSPVPPGREGIGLFRSIFFGLF